MQFDHLHSNQDDGLMLTEDLKALRLRKQKIEINKKARRFILEINQRYRKMRAYKGNNFFKNMNLLKKAA